MNTSLSLLIGEYIHKLNREIGAIRMKLFFLREEKANLIEKDDYVSKVVLNIEESITRISLLSDEFRLSVSNPENLESLSIEKLLKQAIEECPKPKSNNISLEIDKSVSQVLATPKAVDVFKNLITNAYEAMPNGGNVQISAKKSSDDEYIEILFTDEGRGIPSYFVDSLFSPYSSTKNEKGHGLGLWWSRVYLEALGGKLILLKSQVGKGSTFKILIPCSA